MIPSPQMREAPLISASRLLAERGFYGIVWVDESLEVVGRYGSLVGFVEIGQPLTTSVIPFAGLEGDIRALRRAPQTVLDVPSVTIVTSEGRTPRLNLAALWSNTDRCYLVLASLAVVSSDLEVELNRQIRARLMAEADVTAKSQELHAVNTDLARANSDLERFASIISHDLKSPLRELRFLADDAEAALTGGDIAAGLAALAAMREQSTRMSQMLSGLLGYATVGAKSDALEEVDTQALVTSVVRHLPRPPGLRINITGAWPRLTTLAAPLDLVLRNLIDNAIVHHDRESGRIIINARQSPDELVISVSDDGPGIPAPDRQSIFLPFRTLKDGESAGHGMGLAIVTRAVASVGGRIEVLSDAPAERGTTFEVHWPALTNTLPKNHSTEPEPINLVT